MSTIRQASLHDLRKMKDEGKLNAAQSVHGVDQLPADFWADATLVEKPEEARSVRLNLEPEVFEFFKSQGKGHITRMQNVLKSYAEHHRKRSTR